MRSGRRSLNRTGIPDSALARAVRRRRVRGGAARQAALVRARAARSASWSTCAPRGRACTSSCATPAARSRARRGATTGSAWSRARGAAPSEGMQVVVAGGCDYYPGSATSSPGFSFAVSRPAHRRRGRPARAHRPPAQAARRRGAARAAEAPGAAALPRTIGVITGETARRATTCSRRCAAAAGPGAWCGRFAPVQDRHAAPAIVRALGDLAALRRGRRGDRRARRRLARRPAVLLRRDAVPHRRAAERAGDRVRRAPHRPHAARRRRRGQLLDADARRGGGRRRRLRAARAAQAQRPRGCASTHAVRCSREQAAGRRRRLREHGRRAVLARARCWRGSRARPARTSSASARACTSSCARSARARAGACEAERRRHASGERWCSRARPTRRCWTAAQRQPRELSAWRSRSPRTTRSARSSAATRSCETRDGEPLTSAAGARAAQELRAALRRRPSPRACEQR